MHQRHLIALLIAFAAVVAACGSSSDSDPGATSATVDGAVVAVGAAPLPGDAVGSISDAVEVAAAAPAQANATACDIDRRTIGTAVDAFYATTGADPTSEQDLVDAGILQDLLVGWDLAADGSIVPTAGGACV